jgi:hypothetical protein
VCLPDADNVSFSTVTETATGAVVALFVEFRQGTDCHHFITVSDELTDWLQGHLYPWLAATV